MKLSRAEARRYILAQQGLWPPYAGNGKADALAFIRRVGCIQYDPLDVVGRNPELVLQARLDSFQPEMLESLLYEDRALLDGWDKNMSIYPVEDWPAFERRRQRARQQSPRESAREAVEAVLPDVRQELAERGPLSSIDIDFGHTVDWAWAPTRLARAALESMYWRGELIIHHKVHTRKVYDFAANHLPPELLVAPDPNESEEAHHDWYVQRRIGSVGLLWNRSGGAWLGMGDIKSKDRQAAIRRLLGRGAIVEVAVEGIDPPLYLRTEDRTRLEAAAQEEAPARAAVIAPLDNLLWDRDLVQALFDFEYIWEVYKPVAERRYGYYVLPVLYGDRFVARFEPQRDKENGTLQIKQWWWEPGVELTGEMEEALRAGVARFMAYLQAPDLQLTDAAAQDGLVELLDPLL